MLRELKKGEKVLVHSNENWAACPVGSIGTVIRDMTASASFNVFELDIPDVGKVNRLRRHVLAIGDKVVRGPDWNYNNQDGGEGNTGTIECLTGRKRQTVRVKWDNGESPDAIPYYIMCLDRQDLKPTGDSEMAEVSGKPECYGDRETGKNCKGRTCPSCEHFKQECECKTATHDASCPHRVECCEVKVTTYKHLGGDTITITETKEDTMTREQRAVDIDKDVEARESALKEHVALTEEKIADLKSDAKNLRAYKTDKAETIAQIVSVRKCTKKQAEDWLALKDKGIEV